MNFFDYDLTRTGTPPQSAGTEQEPSLNDEVQQVVGQLGKLWGGFRKQSQAAFEAARKDLGSVVAQAQKELGSLASEPSTQSQTAQEGQEGGSSDVAGEQDASSSKEDQPTGRSANVEDETPQPSASSSSTPTASSSSTSPFQSFFQRVQATLPPNISTTLQNNIPESLRDGHLNVDFAQLKSTLTTEFQRVQGVTRAQAEEYVHKSEALFKDAGEFFKDAVKVVPPEEADTCNASIMWDGMDIWTLPTTSSNASAKGKGKRKENDLLVKARASGTRAETLLRQLKRDRALLKTDPDSIDSTKHVYELFVKNDVESKEGGIMGAFWSERMNEILDDGTEEGQSVKAMKEELAPSEMSEETFWTRYFFRVHQIEEDEKKRKALLAGTCSFLTSETCSLTLFQPQGAPESEEDFSWEDDEEENSTPSASHDSVPPIAAQTQSSLAPRISSDTVLADSKSYPSSLVTTPSNTSPRGSSEGSYDLVSNASVSAGPEAKKAEEDDDDADSDWE
ncbi:hypothetical protein SCHPADRAFT_948566 [Schizopora paradoxa]|uniref:BSD domain-containing protein n=1 Tax=Schizopora paradoxa TaxID=27342 RepID=A0A0H2S7V7_9AGAM|nr:hypothetical protein SCHPADRAFT_948566 [Schizopora paradoxa]